MHRPRPEPTLDPTDWHEFRALAHELIDATVDDLEGLPDRHGWRPIPEGATEPFRTPMPRAGRGARAAYEDFVRFAKPFPFGQNTPRFWGWAGGTGTADGILSAMLNAAFHSPNIIHHHAGTWIETQALDWLREAMAFPEGTLGHLTTGCSLANLTGLAVARHVKGGREIRANGMTGQRLTVYGSSATHYSVPKSLDLLGLGATAFRAIPAGADERLNMTALEAAIAEDRSRGCQPICVVGNVGTVGTGAIDPLVAIADLARRENLWFHIDGAFGAIARFSGKHQGLVNGMERADSLAFDLHKWLSQPYDVGCVLVADGAALEQAFTYGTSYTTALPGSLTDSPAVFANRGPELSRALRALPFWISMKTHGADAFGAMVDKNIAQARYLEELIRARPRLELLATGPLSVVNFRYIGASRQTPDALNALNRRLLGEIQMRTIGIPSLYVIEGQASIRVCNLNQRSQRSDFDALVEAVESIGAELEQQR